MSTRLHDLDLTLFRRAANADTPVLDRVLPRLTSSADHGLLWIGVAGALAAAGRRRPAVRGLASLALASAVANVPAKLAVRRERPQLHPVPLPRRLLRQPTTSSFPSGHSASAAAFATGVALEAPLLAPPVGLLAAGVAYGRVHTGVHYPGDVLAGLALGTTAALAVRRVWPVRPETPAVGSTAVTAPALPDGDGLVLVVNTGGGSADQADAVEKLLSERLPRAEVVRTDDLEPALRSAAGRARVLGVMGGDGSVSCATAVALEHDLPLAVVPGGTLDHFAGELGIGSAADTAEAVARGAAVEVSVATAGGLPFLNTFAVGVYPEIVKERERHEGRIGKWPAMVLATARVLRRAEPLQLSVDGQRRELWTLFAGNGHYHPSGFAPSWRERMDDDTLDLRLVDATRPWSRTRLVAALLTGRLGRSRVYEERLADRAQLDGTSRVARDGESHDAPESLVLEARQRLVVCRP